MPVVCVILREGQESCTTRPRPRFIRRIARYGLPAIKTVSQSFNPSITTHRSLILKLPSKNWKFRVWNWKFRVLKNKGFPKLLLRSARPTGHLVYMGLPIPCKRYENYIIEENKKQSVINLNPNKNKRTVSYQYWEYVEDINSGTGEDTQTDPSVSG